MRGGASEIGWLPDAVGNIDEILGNNQSLRRAYTKTHYGCVEKVGSTQEEVWSEVSLLLICDSPDAS